MPTTRTVAIPLGEYPTGIQTFGPMNIGNNVDALQFEFARCTIATPDIWPDAATKLQYDQEVSFDGGNTWIYAGGFGANGGIHVRRDGTEAPISSFLVAVPAGQGRQLRATVTILNGPCRTEGTVGMIS